MAVIDLKYNEILRRILNEGIDKGDRTGTGTRSIFSHTLEYDMKDGFPLLTTKKMFTKGIITELLWFLNGDTNLRYLLENNNKIWVGDAHKRYLKGNVALLYESEASTLLEGHKKNGVKKEDFIELIKTDDEFNNRWGNLGPIYGKQWVCWGGTKPWLSKGWLHLKENTWCVKWSDLHSFGSGTHWLYTDIIDSDQSKYGESDEGRQVKYKVKTLDYNTRTFVPNQVAIEIDETGVYGGGINQIQQAIDALKNNPDSRRIMVSAWNPAEIKDMILPPCHWAFEFYTEELTILERSELLGAKLGRGRTMVQTDLHAEGQWEREITQDSDAMGLPKRKLSLKWHQRSVDVPLGLPFNIASYAFLLEMIAQQVNMVPDKLIGDLSNVHIYQDQLKGVREQLDRNANEYEPTSLTLKKADDIFSYKLEDFTMENYESYPTIKYPLSN